MYPCPRSRCKVLFILFSLIIFSRVALLATRASSRAWFLSWYQHSRPVCDHTACPHLENETEHLLDTPYDWNYTVTPQKGLNRRTFPYNRGKILGGSSSVSKSQALHWLISSIQGCFYKTTWSTNTVPPKIMTRLLRLLVMPDGTGTALREILARCYSRIYLLPVFLNARFQHEKIVPPADGHDTTGQYIPANHGTNGMLSVSLPGSSQLIDSRVIATTRELSEEFPFDEDMGGGDVLGIGWVQSSIADGQRSSSATTYLAAAINRPNVHILLNAQVTKLLRTGTIKGVPSFRSVEFASKPGSELWDLFCGSRQITDAHCSEQHHPPS